MSTFAELFQANTANTVDYLMQFGYLPQSETEAQVRFCKFVIAVFTVSQSKFIHENTVIDHSFA